MLSRRGWRRGTANVGKRLGGLLAALVLVGCGLQTWNGRFGAYYPSDKPQDITHVWTIHIVSILKVWDKCSPLFVACTIPETREVWTIDNPGALWHECQHVRALEAGGNEAIEWVKDLTYGWPLGNIAMILTAPFSAGEPTCG